jgi:membrane protein involved in colicin uptake
MRLIIAIVAIVVVAYLGITLMRSMPSSVNAPFGAASSDVQNNNAPNNMDARAALEQQQEVDQQLRTAPLENEQQVLQEQQNLIEQRQELQQKQQAVPYEQEKERLQQEAELLRARQELEELKRQQAEQNIPELTPSNIDPHPLNNQY